MTTYRCRIAGCLRDFANEPALRRHEATPADSPYHEPHPTLAALARNDMGRVLALALSSQGYAATDSEAVGLALLREIEDCGYTLRLTTPAERRERNAS